MPLPRIILIANYRPDAQQSMLRFADMMANGLRGEGVDVEILAPAPYFDRRSKSMGLGKWLRYLDKFLVFPIRLRRTLSILNCPRGTTDFSPSLESQLSTTPVVHICDHSNSLYAQTVKRAGLPLVITCHDLGAVRGALGEETECKASRTGQLLQNWITKGLGYADIIACVSTATRQDVDRLIRKPNGTRPETHTVLLGQNTSYRRISDATAHRRLATFDWCQPELPFVINVGSSLPRKNRDGVLRIFARTKERWSAVLVFAGQALTEADRNLLQELGLKGRVFEVLSPSDEVLEALYNRAHALLFPSKFEGFGWPVIEAQACGCPVLCSDAASLAEVAGNSAFVRPWSAEEQFANELLFLATDPQHRKSSIEKGRANLTRFETARMITDYLEIYQAAASGVRLKPVNLPIPASVE